VGIDDWSWNRTDWFRALHGIDKRRPSVMLSHQPSVLDRAETAGISLILSGHTHGGQVNLPFIGPPARFFDKDFKYIRGHYEREGTQLFVSRGTGTIGMGVRLGARPEIAVIRLKSAS
jgi:hypothetical protein